MRNLIRRLVLLAAVAVVPALAAQTYADLHPNVTFHQDVLLLAGSGALAAALFLIAAEAFIRRPVNRLLAVADRLRQGDLSARVGTAPAGLEFARLGAALDEMAAAQEARELALRDALAAAGVARAALAESEARLRLALAAADVGVSELDVPRARCWMDDRAAVLLQGLLPANIWLERDDPALAAWYACIHPDDWPLRRAAGLAVMQGQSETLSVEYRFRDPSGGWRWMAERGAVVARDRSTGAPQRIVGVWRDITAQRDAAAALEREVAERTAALAESERRFRGIFHSAFQLTALLSPDGTLLEANRAALTFMGYTEDEVRGRKLWEVSRLSEERNELLRPVVACAAGGEFVRYETELSGPGGAATMDFSLKPVFAEDGTVTMLVAEARDITERAKLQAQLAQAQKMEAVGQLTGGIAHDFNNLLQAVTGNLDLIHRQAEQHGDARVVRLATNAQRSAARGARLTQQLLAFSRRQNLQPERVWVSRLIAGMGELLRRAAGETIEVHTHAAVDLWPCHIDPAQFESALLNLAINARDAMPEGGTLAVSAANAVLETAEAAAHDIPPGPYVRVDVADTGTGIPAELLGRLFEPFFTTKEIGKGTGLGLAMVHGFARQSGGVVSVASEPGHGTVFTLFLPRDEGGAPPQRPMRVDLPRTAAVRDILLVEDDDEVRDAVQFSLSDAGHRVTEAPDAPEALAILESGVPLDLLICDLMLPGDMDGIDVAEAARRQRPGLRVLLASGYGTELGARGARFEVLPKPFSQSELLRRVASVPAPAPAG